MFIIAGVPLLHAVGSRLQIGQQDFTQLVRLERADGLVILEYLECHIGHDFHGLPVVFENPQTGQLLVFESGRNGFAGGNRNRHYSIDVRLPAVDTGDFTYFIGSGLEVGKNRCTARLGLLGVGGSGFNVLDLDGNALQPVAGVGKLFDAQTAVGSVLKGDRGHLAVGYRYCLGGILGKSVVFRRYNLRDGVGAGNGQRHHDGAAGVGGILANDVAAGAFDFKDGTGQRRLGAFLDLDDFQPGFRVIRDFAGAVLADG